MSRFTIALSGLAEADAAQFRTALGGLQADHWKLVDGPAAYLMVVDIDTVWGHMDWLRATASGQRVMVFTGTEARDCDLLLRKPLHIEAFSALLDEVVAQAELADSGNAVAAPATPASAPVAAKPHAKPAPVRAAVAPPAAAPQPVVAPVAAPPPAPLPPPAPAAPATLGECLLAGRIEQPLGIGANGLVLQLDPERGGYHGATTLKPLQPLLNLPVDSAHALDQGTLDRMRQSPALPLTRLLWFTALCSTPGQLAPTLDPQAIYRLTRWPQIEREFPRHFRIATAMMKQPGTLEEVAATASAPLSDVIDFVNAYSVAGYVFADAVAPEAAAEPAATGMLSRLRRPFARGGQEA